MINAKTKARWDYYAAIDGAKIMGHEQGKIEGANEKAIEMASKLKVEGFSIDKIAELTELSIIEIQALK